MTEFEGFGLKPNLLRALTELGYESPTPIQAQAIPLAIQGKDIIGCARTGTGKTAAFAIPVLHRLQGRAPKPYCLVLAPTRELAVQIEASFRAYAKHLRLRMCVLYGGVGVQPQVQKLKHGVDIVVATPGRLMDHMERGTVDLSGIQVLVLDEADRMLDMGFEPQVRAIVRAVPKERQTLLFSATVPPAILKLSHQYLNSPEYVEAERSGSTVDGVQQLLHMVAPEQKEALLLRLLETEDPESALIFTRTKRGAESLSRSLRRRGIPVECMHGDVSQKMRERIIAGFRNRSVRVLVATDVAARGLDIPHISHVFNYDVPDDAEDYVHRIGRTARAERTGIAITLASAKDAAAVSGIESLISCSIHRARLDDFEYRHDTSHITAAATRSGRGGGGGAGGRRTDAVLAYLDSRYGKSARSLREPLTSKR